MDNRPGMRYSVPMKRFACVVSLVLCALVPSGAQAASGADIFGLPVIQDRFSAIKRDLMAAVQAQDHGAMEDACRAGRALLPADPTFAYNLACALARQGKAGAALDTLREAVALGFRNADQIRRDDDLTLLRTSPAFADVLKLASTPPAADAPRSMNDVTPTPLMPGDVAWVSSTNTLWDFDAAMFRSAFALSADSPRLAPADADAYRGPAQPLLAGWLREGRAVGNVGDLYDNRDDGHSALKVADFPGLARIVYGAEAASTSNRPYYGAAQFIYNLPTFGNSSTALTQGPFWRCQARMLVCNPLRVGGLFNLYVANHIYVYPSHQDYQAGQGDVFPFNTPYFIVSKGSSGSDQPFLRALAATLAAFTPETKRILVQNRLLAPTVQMILRATQRSVTHTNAYYTGVAHPAVFVSTNLNVDAMIRLANALTSNTIPPLVTLRVLQERQPVYGRDFFDGFPAAGLYDSPACIARVFRGVGWSHSLTVAASAMALPGATNLTWRWTLLQGDPTKVTIRTLDPAGQVAAITVAYHEPGFPSAADPSLAASRVDIAAFAHNGAHPSAPAFLSFYFLNNETRVYSADHRILSVDYAAASRRYVDPALSYRRDWKDVYRYDAKNRLTGWDRSRGLILEAFTADGLRVETRDALGRPQTARAVRYLPRTPVNDKTLPDLVQVNDERTFTYTYSSFEDGIGRPVAND
jgi:hypothetical protein